MPRERPDYGKVIEFHDAGPDSLGRRFFTMHWTEVDGIFREDLSKDGWPSGYQRGQCYFCEPDRFIMDGARVK